MLLKSIALLALLGGRVSGAGTKVNYAKLGEDWPSDKEIKNNECAGDY